MHDLRNVWEIGGLIEDQNGDLVADRVNVQILLPDGLFPQGLIDFCARLGFETTSLSFDFFRENKRYAYELTFTFDDSKTAVKLTDRGLCCSYRNEQQLSDLLRFLAGKWHAQFIETDCPVKKIALIDNKISIFSTGDQLITQCEWRFEASRANKSYKLESLTDVWSEVGFLHQNEPSPDNKQSVIIQTSGELSRKAWIEIYYGAARIGMESTSLAFPITRAPIEKTPVLIFEEKNEDQMANVTLEGNVVVFSGNKEALPNAISYFFREKHWTVGGTYGNWEAAHKKLKRKKEVLFVDTWQDTGELQEIYGKLEKAKQCIDVEKHLEINAFISEPKELREQLLIDIQKKYPRAHIFVRSAFKPGFFWMMEEVLPQIVRNKGEIDAVIINCRNGTSRDGLELPIRWIQELYPIDEIFAQELGIISEKIQFKISDSIKHTYEIIVTKSNGNILFSESITIPVSKVPYVEKGKYSYPTSSYLSLKQGQHHLEYVIKTDRERFYTFYMNKVMPRLWEEVRAKGRNRESGFTKPLFDHIEIEAVMSEEECKLPVEEERISSLEALHEDLYFNTLDYFVIKGEALLGKGYTSPGGIYPFLKAIPGASPSAKITVYKYIEQGQDEILTEKLWFRENQKHPFRLQYRFENDDKIHIKELTERYEAEEIPQDLPKPKQARVHTWLADYSYGGRPIFVYEYFNRMAEDYFSAIKLSIFKPTILIETGHHANEVSSMPAAAELLDEIETMFPLILKNMNLVVIPRANPDGTALHNRMAKDNPQWKHHAARYNAVGLEYADLRYRNSVFGEANVVPKIMNRWAPDVIIDNHGIPSHEWTQPFAGYHIPPRFHMSYWIPNALLFGIVRMLDQENYPKHTKILNKMTESIQQIIKPTEIQQLNQYWMERYKKYGHQFMPQLFPIELAEDLIFYKWDTKPNPEISSAISRFPEWVSADLISEVADETVYGDVLERCKKAQKLFNLGAIKWIKKDAQEIKRIYDGSFIGIIRIRPLKIDQEDQ
ncbi:M14 family metallopeptidase [Siminovitchia sp. 179-K 8D1 HS]|uniref:M14 family metallopeptidase n=1 Tax=Siminovitchia sp. 179-K 8D1 HS TaxID=3142385 RepID=UPI00399F1F42